MLCNNAFVDHKELAAMCNAIGDPTRAHILQLLMGCCCEVAVDEGGEVSPVQGLTAGEVCCHITGGEKITSTVSFHLDKLRQAGLIDVERRGKHMICRANREAVAKLAGFFNSALESSGCC